MAGLQKLVMNESKAAHIDIYNKSQDIKAKAEAVKRLERSVLAMRKMWEDLFTLVEIQVGPPVPLALTPIRPRSASRPLSR